MGKRYFVNFYRGERHICRVYEFSRDFTDIRIGDIVDVSLVSPIIELGLLPLENSKKLGIYLMRMEKKINRRNWKWLEVRKLETELFPDMDPFQFEDPDYEDTGQFEDDEFDADGWPRDGGEILDKYTTREEILEYFQCPPLRAGKVVAADSTGPSYTINFYTIDFGGAVMTFPYDQVLGPIVSVDEYEIPPLDDPMPKVLPVNQSTQMLVDDEIPYTGRNDFWFPSPDALFNRWTPVLEIR